MNILEDTRQQKGKHDNKSDYFSIHGVNLLRSKIPFGDYCLPPRVSVDTKQNIYELAQDIDQEHQRFKTELVTAKEYGCKLIILVENTDNVHNLQDLSTWQEEYEHYAIRLSKNYKAKRIEGSRLARACATMSERYGATFLFCSPDEAGQKIMEILSDGMDKT